MLADQFRHEKIEGSGKSTLFLWRLTPYGYSDGKRTLTDETMTSRFLLESRAMINGVSSCC